jgi:hypothetical protein
MRAIASILVLWLSLLTVQPVIAEVCIRMQPESCCNDRCAKENMPCKSDDEESGKCCMSGVCNPCSICSCCFGATIEKENFRFIPNIQQSGRIVSNQEEALQGFLSSPFQPPEFFDGALASAA